MLWELAKHRDVQTRLRQEIESTRAAGGGAPLTADNLERMPYLQAVVKVRRAPIHTYGSLLATSQEHLRFHAPVHHVMRRSAEDDVLPLFEPIKTQSGTLITQVPLPAGTNLVLAFATYNRYAEHLLLYGRLHSLTYFLVTKRSGVMMRMSSDRRGGSRRGKGSARTSADTATCG